MKTVLDFVLQHAAEDPDRLCVRLVSRRQTETAKTFGEIAKAAAQAAAFLNRHGIKPGDVVVFIGTHHIDFYANWLGIVWLGAIPTVLAEPGVRIDKQIYWTRLSALFERIKAKAVTIDPQIRIESDWIMKIPHFTYSQVAEENETPLPAPAKANPDDILLLQHSSGTTGLQKGVMLSHQAVINHAQSYFKALEITPEDKIVSWLPLYHDMGFIACFLNPLIAGTPVIWLSPFEWVAGPALLLDAVSRYRATLTWLPNFAFAFLAQRVKEAPGTYDLSSLRAVINCSEPVTAQSMDTFTERFSSDGLRPDVVHTCYAMAENVFAVTATTDRIRPHRLRIDKYEWTLNHRAVPVDDHKTESTLHVSNGVCVENCEVRIVDNDGMELEPYYSGRVLIYSSFLFDGYHCRSDLNGNLFDNKGFYDTGDIGYVDADSHVYITGRAKDLIIIGGRNIYPQDVEQLANETAGVHTGRAVCFGVEVLEQGTEGLVLLVESDLEESGWMELSQRLRKMIPARLDLDVLDVRVVPTGSLRKSTAGKLARSGNRDWYLEEKFGELPRQLKKHN